MGDEDSQKAKPEKASISRKNGLPVAKTMADKLGVIASILAIKTLIYGLYEDFSVHSGF